MKPSDNKNWALFIKTIVYRGDGSKLLELNGSVNGPSIWVATNPMAELVDLNGTNLRSLLIQPNPSEGQLLASGTIIE